MELLLVLFVLFVLFIVLPAVAIAGIFVVLHKPTREKVRAKFGQGSAAQPVKQQVVDTDKDDITQDYVDFMNNNILHNESYVFTKFEKSRKGAVSAEVEMIPLFQDAEPYELTPEEKNKLNEQYLQFIIDHGYVEKIAATDKNNVFAVKKLIKEMNDEVYQTFGREVWDNSSLAVQDVFQLFKRDYQGEHSVPGIAVMVQVNRSEVFKTEDFEDLKTIVEYGLNSENEM